MHTAFAPTRTAALERLSRFVPLAGHDYAARRNYDLGPGRHTHVSTLSPYLRCRLLTEEEVLQAVLTRHSLQAAEKFIQEVYWRTYWKGWLELRPAVWQQYQNDLSRAWDSIQTQSGLRIRWEQACKGETDIDCFNAWAHELVETGYLHNHARMWFASIWIFTLELPWELGADFFLRHLLDGDPASNTLGWRWVAGIQTQGKTYLARTSNIAKFTEGRFHPKWQLVSEAVPRTGAPPPAPRFLPQSDGIANDARTALLLHEEDLSPAFMLKDIQPVACAVLRPQLQFGPLQTAPHVEAFRAAALQDSVTRWQSRIGPVTHLADSEALAKWARAAGVDQIATAYAPTGPVAELLDRYDHSRDAPPLRRVMRPYDRAAWPHATKGFFPFKKYIPDFLAQLG
jgi:deoxyribodipyrimidine photo-lyase